MSLTGSGAEQELREQVKDEAANLKKETELALAKAEEKERALAAAALKHKADLAAQKSALEEESAKVLSEKEKAFTRKLALQKKLLAEVAEEIST